MLVILLGILYALERMDAFAGMNTAVNDFMNRLAEFGFVGMLIIAVIGNSSLLVQVPYTVPLFSVALSGASLHHMLFLGLGSGIGAGIGEIISYMIADKVLAYNPDLPNSKLFRWTSEKIAKHPRLIFWLVFIWAFSLLPDDTVIIPLAMVRYGVRRMMLPLFLGKLAHNLLMAWVMFRFTEWVARYISTDVKTDMALGILIIFITVILYQVEKAKATMKNYNNAQATIN